MIIGFEHVDSWGSWCNLYADNNLNPIEWYFQCMQIKEINCSINFNPELYWTFAFICKHLVSPSIQYLSLYTLFIFKLYKHHDCKGNSPFLFTHALSAINANTLLGLEKGFHNSANNVQYLRITYLRPPLYFAIIWQLHHLYPSSKNSHEIM